MCNDQSRRIRCRNVATDAGCARITFDLSPFSNILFVLPDDDVILTDASLVGAGANFPSMHSMTATLLVVSSGYS